MSSSQANELVTTSGSQKKIWISWKDKKKLTGKREKKASINKIKNDIIFFDISRFATQTFVGGWYCGVVTKIEST